MSNQAAEEQTQQPDAQTPTQETIEANQSAAAAKVDPNTKVSNKTKNEELAKDPKNRVVDGASTQLEGDTYQKGTVQQLANLQEELVKIDKDKGKQAMMLMNEYTMLTASSYHKPAKNSKGQTAADVYEEWQKLTEDIGKQKKVYEDKIHAILNPTELTSDEIKQFRKVQIERANTAAQEIPRDLTKFKNDELDGIRAKLQQSPLKADNASVDDGTGGEGKQQ